MKKILVIFLTMVLFSSCVFEKAADDNSGSNGNGDTNTKYKSEFFGEWLRMDGGAVWYITGDTITIDGKKRTSAVDLSFFRESARVVKVTEGSSIYYLYASRIATSSFNGMIVGDGSGTKSVSRGIGSGLGSINVSVSNLNNKVQSEVKTSADGSFTADNIIAGDEYEIKAANQTTVVLPNTNNDNIGTIAVTGGANFKTTIQPKNAGTDMNQLYAGLYSYEFVITILNTGTSDCMGPKYTLDLESGLVCVSGSLVGTLSTIEPGKSRTISLTLSCYPGQSEYEFKKIGITIEDTISKKIWDDSVSVKFNREIVNFIVRANSAVRGVIIAPNAKAYPFNANQSTWTGSATVYNASLPLPRSESDYLVVFSGATANTEAKYSLGINKIPSTNFSGFSDIGIYKPNQTEEQAPLISNKEEIMAYLYKNYIDYYRINLGPLENSVYKPVIIYDRAFGTSYTPQTQLTAGSTYNFDIKVQNVSYGDALGVTTVLSSTSAYITITQPNGNIRDIKAGYYKSVGYTYSATSVGDSSASSTPLLGQSSLPNCFKFTVSSSYPAGTKIPLTVTFKDQRGTTWTDTVSIP